MTEKLKGKEAARKFVNNHFPECQAALLAGSVVRGEGTETSDLDIVVFDERLPSSYRESLYEYGWPIEVFAHNFTSYKEFYKSDIERARPSLPRMVAEGIIIKKDVRVKVLKQEAAQILEQGPAPWTEEDIRSKRYFLTDTLDDFIGCEDRAEGMFIAQTLAELTAEFILRTNNQWVGSSKWWARALRQFDKKFAERLFYTFDCYFRNDEKELVMNLVKDVLRPYGGRLFEGFSLGKR
ncbi:nucleotidyltransferase domain-containing protein [Halobacillus mangrovi]|uniref:Nucleotidyltransferase n=1 Tax=Halobacillus mangrovi TaxID=402384 RepID=A0A1W6A0L2_9BACI|nr:nucleotidyltransferase domain-containing protein [Halobacillus mangrovi]ARI79050.1 nucleotidyltransferase [Halobacillus mangrovi]